MQSPKRSQRRRHKKNPFFPFFYVVWSSAHGWLLRMYWIFNVFALECDSVAMDIFRLPHFCVRSATSFENDQRKQFNGKMNGHFCFCFLINAPSTSPVIYFLFFGCLNCGVRNNYAVIVYYTTIANPSELKMMVKRLAFIRTDFEKKKQLFVLENLY